MPARRRMGHWLGARNKSSVEGNAKRQKRLMPRDIKGVMLGDKTMGNMPRDKSKANAKKPEPG